MFAIFVTIHLAFIHVQFHFSNQELFERCKLMSLFFQGENSVRKVNTEGKNKHFVVEVSDWKRPVSVP